MKPKLHEYTSKKAELGSIVSCISGFNCSSYFGSHIEKSQSEQKSIVNKFQVSICNALAEATPAINWQMEYSPHSSKRDSIDIFGSNNDFYIVVELDKHRADQVAKKFVSRSSLLVDKTFSISHCVIQAPAI